MTGKDLLELFYGKQETPGLIDSEKDMINVSRIFLDELEELRELMAISMYGFMTEPSLKESVIAATEKIKELNAQICELY